MAKARSPKIHPYRRRRNQVLPIRLIWEKSHHEILQQTPRMLQLYVRPARSIARLLEEDGVSSYLSYINWYAETLAGKYCIHDWYVLMRQVPGHGED